MVIHATPALSTTRRGAVGTFGASMAGLLGLAACGIGGGTGGEASPGKVAGKLTWLSFTSTEPAIDRTNKLATSFREKYPNVELSVEMQPTGFTQKINTLLAAGTPPDVHWIGAAFWELVGDGVFVDLDPIIAREKRFNLKEYYGPALSAFTFPDKLRALPYGVNTHTMTFNKRLFQKEGLPLPTKDWTVQQFTELARRFTKDTNGDGTMDQSGFGNFPHLHTAAHFLGGGFWDKGHTKPIIDSPESIAAWEWRWEVQYGQRSTYPTKQMLEGTNLNKLMGQGKVAFYSTGRFAVPVLRSFTDLDWDMVVYPTGPTGKKATFMSGEGYAMNSETKDQEAAWKLLEHLCGREAQEQFYIKEGNVIPAIKAVAESKAFGEADPGKNHKAHLDSIAFGVQPNSHPVDPGVYREIIAPLWKDVTDGKIPAREMGRLAAPRMAEMLRDWNAQHKK